MTKRKNSDSPEPTKYVCMEELSSEPEFVIGKDAAYQSDPKIDPATINVEHWRGDVLTPETMNLVVSNLGIYFGKKCIRYPNLILHAISGKKIYMQITNGDSFDEFEMEPLERVQELYDALCYCCSLHSS